MVDSNNRGAEDMDAIEEAFRAAFEARDRKLKRTGVLVALLGVIIFLLLSFLIFSFADAQMKEPTLEPFQLVDEEKAIEVENALLTIKSNEKANEMYEAVYNNARYYLDLYTACKLGTGSN